MHAELFATLAQRFAEMPGVLRILLFAPCISGIALS